MDPQEIKMIVQRLKDYDNKKIKIDKNKLKSATSKITLGSWDNNMQELKYDHGIYFYRNI
tara:strand:+ start:488 stop:667 length:180 start_codon:yes stop_codon:yes gene_type:complete